MSFIKTVVHPQRACCDIFFGIYLYVCMNEIWCRNWKSFIFIWLLCANYLFPFLWQLRTDAIWQAMCNKKEVISCIHRNVIYNVFCRVMFSVSVVDCDVGKSFPDGRRKSQTTIIRCFIPFRCVQSNEEKTYVVLIGNGEIVASLYS